MRLKKDSSYLLLLMSCLCVASLLMEPQLLARIPSTKPAKRKALSRLLDVFLVKRKKEEWVHQDGNLLHWVCVYNE